MLRRALSWLWPTTEARTEGHFGRLEVRWENGRKVLNSANANQSFGALHRVWKKTLTHLDLSADPPRSVLMLGLGAGSAVAILREELGIPCPITAVELDPEIVRLAHTHFQLGRFRDLKVMEGDATIQIHALRDRYDLVLVDLFDDLDLARGVDSRSFVHGLRDRCSETGRICFNTVAYDEVSDRRCQAVHDHTQRVFHGVEELRLEEVNRMFIAW
ncbi:MAG TPA: fused MFS/spermidine synthase [Flavobacteriales bacterium]|nr:fused MFS/spermidine synthase [Flavobacteriales bacterium]